MNKIVLSIVLVNLLAACASEKPKEAANEPAGTSSATAAPVATAAPAASTQTSAADAAAAQAAAARAAMTKSVYFPFDVDAVQPGDRALVQAAGEALGKNTDAKVRVEGNADERGSSEYNLALGQRRANSVKKMLVISGANTAQVDTISFGEEKPRCMDHNEACWSQNRRADIVPK